MNDLEFQLILNDRLCDVADAILLYHNPCKWENGHCLIYKSEKDAHLHCCYRSKYDVPNSYRFCVFLKDGKCGFRNIGCKTFLCATAILENPMCAKDLKDLENLALRYGLTRRPLLGQRYVGMTEELALRQERLGG